MTPAIKELVEAAEEGCEWINSHEPACIRLRVAVEAVKAEQSKHDAGDERLMLDILYGDDTEAN